MDQQELWRSVPGFEGLYEVSSLGNVHSVRSSARLKSFPVGSGGYLGVALWRSGKAHQVLVHRLVMLAFVGPCPDGLNTNHKDGNKKNPALSNLEYVTPKANIQHAVETGLIVHGPRGPRKTSRPCNVGAANKNARIDDALVGLIRARLEAGERPTSLAGDLGVSRWTVYNIKYGRRWRHVAAT